MPALLIVRVLFVGTKLRILRFTTERNGSLTPRQPTFSVNDSGSRQLDWGQQFLRPGNGNSDLGVANVVHLCFRTVFRQQLGILAQRHHQRSALHSLGFHAAPDVSTVVTSPIVSLHRRFVDRLRNVQLTKMEHWSLPAINRFFKQWPHQHKRSSTENNPPTAAQRDPGELAINTQFNNATLHFEDATFAVRHIGRPTAAGTYVRRRDGW